MKDYKSMIASDSYLKPRKDPTQAQLRLYLREVNYHCPLCGKELQSRKQQKSNSLFEIAHIYPNSPTDEQYATLLGAERLGDDSECYENKIALCKDCHSTQDYHTSLDDYIKLLDIKKKCLRISALHDATRTLGLEVEIEKVVLDICKLSQEDFSELSYTAINIANKFTASETLIKTKISSYVFTYFTYIRDLFAQMDGCDGFMFSILSSQIHCAFQKMYATNASKNEIFDSLVNWIGNKTHNASKEACEAVVSFFVQNCEVFYEIS